MYSTTIRHYQVAPGYRIPVKPTPEQIRQAAKQWFNKRKFRKQTRQILHFISLPNYVTLKYKLR